MRLSTSRPSWSVPSQCAAEGGLSLVERTCLRGSAGAMSGADTATRINMAIRINPATLSGLRLQAGRHGRAGMAGIAGASTMADPRVKPVITYIHDQVRDGVDQRRQQSHTH